MSDSKVLEAINLSRTYVEGPNKVSVLSGVNISVGEGERIAITGASGAGKSTLLHLLGGLDNPTQGTVKLCGQSLSTANQKRKGQLRNQFLGFVYQFHHLLPEFTTLENVCMPLLIRGMNEDFIIEEANRLLDEVSLSHRMNHKPSELSGGERQRAAVARAVITRPKCILADEPTGNLDSENAIKILELILTLNSEFKTSLIIVTHEKEIAEKMDKIYLIKNGDLILK